MKIKLVGTSILLSLLFLSCLSAPKSQNSTKKDITSEEKTVKAQETNEVVKKQSPSVAANATPQLITDDPYIWLEEVESQKSLDWVNFNNSKSLNVLEYEGRYKKIYSELKEIVMATDRIPSPALRNGLVYNFWQDSKQVHGVWRRASVVEYAKKIQSGKTF